MSPYGVIRPQYIKIENNFKRPFYHFMHQSLTITWYYKQPLSHAIECGRFWSPNHGLRPKKISGRPGKNDGLRQICHQNSSDFVYLLAWLLTDANWRKFRYLKKKAVCEEITPNRPRDIWPGDCIDQSLSVKLLWVNTWLSLVDVCFIDPQQLNKQSPRLGLLMPTIPTPGQWGPSQYPV